MTLMQLCERGIVRSDGIMGEIGDDVFMRVVHRRMSGCEFSMLIMVWRRFGLQLARRKTEVWMEDECIIASIDGHIGPLSRGRQTGNRRVKNDCSPVPIVGKFEISKRISTVEVQCRTMRSVRHGQDAVGIAIVNRAE